LGKSLTILGSGYTAKFLLPLAQRHYPHVFATSRDPNRHLSHLNPDQRIRFDLARPETWQAIPPSTDIIWCFPAIPIELVRQFADAASLHIRRLVVLGSTSAYPTRASSEYPPPWIDETTPIDLTQPRVQSEEYLRTHCAATVLRVAGIYGPGRNPLDWIKKGRVGPSRKYVNLIHVEDLAAICLATLERGFPGEAYNVSDGTPRTWEEICNVAERRWGIRPVTQTDTEAAGKRLLNKRLLELLKADHVALRHSNFFDALGQIGQ
jgi:hypothetical protein